MLLKTSRLTNSRRPGLMIKKKGEKQGMSCAKCVKTNGEKMSTFRLSRMLMKTNDLHPSFQDIDENKGERRLTRDQQKVACSHSSLPTSIAAALTRHGRDGHGTRRGTGVAPVTVMARMAMALPSDTMLSGAGAGRSRDSGRDARATSAFMSRTLQGGSSAVLRLRRGYNWFWSERGRSWDSSPD
jgi:hypothetical protein